jgi:hypothetical protein
MRLSTEADLPVGALVARLQRKSWLPALVLAALVLPALTGGSTFAAMVAAGSENSTEYPRVAIATPLPAGRDVALMPWPALSPDGIMAGEVPSVQTPSTADRGPGRAAFRDDTARASLLDVKLPPAAGESSIPTVQALAAATGGALSRPTIVSTADTESVDDLGGQTLIPLPPAAWTGMAGLVTLGALSKLRRLRRMIG